MAARTPSGKLYEAIPMFAYGFLSVVLMLHLAQLRLGQGLIGLLFSLMLIVDAAISIWLGKD